MESKTERLKEHYSGQTTDDLLELHARDTLTETAYAVLEDELRHRGVTTSKRQPEQLFEKNRSPWFPVFTEIAGILSIYVIAKLIIGNPTIGALLFNILANFFGGLFIMAFAVGVGVLIGRVIPLVRKTPLSSHAQFADLIRTCSRAGALFLALLTLGGYYVSKSIG